MTEAGIGRLLVASLHQGVAELLPSRQEFYAAWLNPANLRAGRIGLAPLAAVLSFLRQEGEPYSLVMARAGECAAEWTYGGQTRLRRRLIHAAPPVIRMVLVGWMARDLVRSTYQPSRLDLRWQSGRAEAVLKGSIFCEVREPVARPLCEYYAAAIRRLMHLFGLRAEVSIAHCRGVEAGSCRILVLVQPAGVEG
jgi:hypothetical protein